MSTYNIRLNAFESTKEKDITDILDNLNNHHRLNQFVANSIRFVLQNKEAYHKFTKEQLNTYGLDYDKAKFFSDVIQQINKMKNKVNSVYEMASNVYVLAQMNKKLGLEEKSANLLSASFILERQVRELENSLGVDIGSDPFLAGRLEDSKKRAEQAMELIIEAYDDILTEIKTNVVQHNQMIQVANIVQNTQQTVVENDNIKDERRPAESEKEVAEDKEVENSEVKEETPKEETKTITLDTKDELSDDDYIDFGNADISALDRFLAGSN